MRKEEPWRQSTPRSNKHPRDPRIKATASSTARLPGTADGVELGADFEEQVHQEALERERIGESGSASSSHNPRPASGEGPSGLDPEAGPYSKRARAKAKAQGVDIDAVDFDPTSLGYTPRYRRKWKDTGSGENPQDWTSFDLSKVLRVLRTANPNMCKLTLRKLHLRWWHAQAAPMRRLLTHAGVPQSVTDLIQDVVDTCSF